jgi:transposase
MGYFSNLAIDIEEALVKGATVEQIATRFDLSIDDVQSLVQQLDEADRDPVYYGA